ncbi:MAG: 4-(cytidine 5'-diphospho)-2-C-methyl-D-erythritol kinase [Deltaproteobacteria bacterium]|nr:4-(cytidine 5'-diphospho)-2-C-methyl-D-erythritol kinase [Deltaproteobacteria bacterium]
MSDVFQKAGAFSQVRLTIRTPAKITADLKILARRPDGFHEVRLVLAPVSIFDELSVQALPPRPDQGEELNLRVEGEHAVDAGDDNLVIRAARAFCLARGISARLEVNLKKNVPAGAGLGGGSANAAGMLVALNHLSGEPLQPDDLRRLAAGLGSDVPFFIEPAPALATGRGEHLDPLPGFPAAELLVVKPGFSISTAEAYGLCRPRNPQGKYLADGSMPSGNVRELARLLANDFEGALLPRYPELERIKRALLDSGALGAVLSGSGSAVAGVFPAAEDRDRAAVKLSGVNGWNILPCHVLPSYRYLP